MSGTTATVRVTVIGGAGTVDLVVPASAPVSVLAEQYAAVWGVPDTPPLASLRGEALAAGRTLRDSDLRHGAVVVALDAPAGGSPDGTADGTADGTPASPPRSGQMAAAGRRHAVVAAVAAAGAAAAALAALGPDPRMRVVVALVLLLGAGVALLPWRSGSTRTRVAAPGLAGAAGFAGLYDSSRGGVLLAVAVAGLAAAAAAALGRSEHDQGLDDRMRTAGRDPSENADGLSETTDRRRNPD